ncbi:MAG: hypothetical protein GY754_00175 [bacterium]|nr:hypothetical protein [bacterium]
MNDKNKKTEASIIEYLYTNENPETGAAPPEHMAWVVFKNGTVYLSAPCDELPVDSSLETIALKAKEALNELGPVVPGAASADFNVSLLDGWFPEDSIYLVTYTHPNIASIIIGEEDEETVAGMEGRSRRDMDLENTEIIVVRGFDGTKE